MNGQTIFRVTKIITRYGLTLLYFRWSFLAIEALVSRGNPFTVSLLYIVFLEGFWLLFEAYHVEQRRILDLLYGQFFGALCANVFFGLLLGAVWETKLWRILEAFFWLVLLEWTAGLSWAFLFFRFYLKTQSCKKGLLIYGEREDPERILEKNRRMNRYFQIQKALHFREGVDSIVSMIEEYDTVYLGDIPYTQRNQIMKACVKKGVDCYSIPKISDLYIQNTTILRLHDQVMIRFPKGRLTPWQSRVKRCFDLLVSGVLFLLTLPIMGVIVLCIYLEDGRPVYYLQDRITMDGKPFKMIKFRSMIKDAEKNGARLAAKNDSRITRTGRIIRNLHFDELPQLINVLKGDMSLVGPRPEREEFIEEYAQVIPEFKERLKVRGGLTGYAQIYGKYNTGPEDKIKYDLMYIYHYSLGLDIRLIFLTIRILFQKENTEGVDKEQRNALKKM